MKPIIKIYRCLWPIFYFLGWTAFGQTNFTPNQIHIGASPNGEDSDPLRVVYQKVNSNLQAVATALVNGVASSNAAALGGVPAAGYPQTNSAAPLTFSNPSNKVAGIFTGDGSALTGLGGSGSTNASYLGGVPAAGYPQTNSAAPLTFSNPSNKVAGIFTGDGSALTGLGGSGSNLNLFPATLLMNGILTTNSFVDFKNRAANTYQTSQGLPRRGWNTFYSGWGNSGQGAPDPSAWYATDVLSAADAIITNGMYAAGYNWIMLDDNFIGGRSNGVIFPNTNTMPGLHAWNDGLSNLVSMLHAKGFKYVSVMHDAGPVTCNGNVGAMGYWSNDVATLRDWKLDGIISDFCVQGYSKEEIDFSQQQQAYWVHTIAPKMFLMYYGGGYTNADHYFWTQDSATWGEHRLFPWMKEDGNMFFYAPEWGGNNNWQLWTNMLFHLDYAATAVSLIGPQSTFYMNVMSGNIPLERMAAEHSIWAMFHSLTVCDAAPFYYPAGPDVMYQRQAPFTNQPVLSLAEDPLCNPPTIISSGGFFGTQILYEKIAGGYSVLLLNRGTNGNVNISFDYASTLGLGSNAVMYGYDLWNNTNCTFNGTISESVPAFGCFHFNLSPLSPGTNWITVVPGTNSVMVVPNTNWVTKTRMDWILDEGWSLMSAVTGSPTISCPFGAYSSDSSSTAQVIIPLPSYVTNVTARARWQCTAATAAWTNQWIQAYFNGSSYYTRAGSDVYDPVIAHSANEVTNTVTLSYPPGDTAPKFIWLYLNPSTNAAGRFLNLVEVKYN